MQTNKEMVVFVTDEEMIDAKTAFFPCLPQWENAKRIVLELVEINNKNMLNKKQYNKVLASWEKSNLDWVFCSMQIDVSYLL